MDVLISGDFSRYVTLRRGEMSELLKPLPPTNVALIRGWKPYFRGGTMTDTKHATVKDEPKSAPKASLAPASESSDPGVHKLLGERQAHVTNIAALTPDESVQERLDAAKAAVAGIDKQLADEYGVTAQ